MTKTLPIVDTGWFRRKKGSSEERFKKDPRKNRKGSSRLYTQKNLEYLTGHDLSKDKDVQIQVFSQKVADSVPVQFRFGSAIVDFCPKGKKGYTGNAYMDDILLNKKMKELRKQKLGKKSGVITLHVVTWIME